MTLRHLKIFIAVAQCGKMSQAARELFISQPSVSQAIHELEEHYGVILFERLSQKLYITENGKKLLPLAKHVIDSYDTMDSTMRNSMEHPIIKVGASVTAGTCILGDIISRMEKSMNNIDFRVEVSNTARIEEMVSGSMLDIGIVEGAVKDEELIQIPIYDDELVIIAGKGHPFFDMDEITLSMLKGQALIAREDESMMRNQYDMMLLDNGIELKQKWICTNTETIKNAVIRGEGIAIVSKLMVKEEVSKGTIKIISVENVNIKRKINLIYHKNKFISEYLNEFIRLSRDTYINA